MSLIDFTNLLSNNQATASTEISDNVVNLAAVQGARQLGFVWVNCVVSVTYTSSGAIQVALMEDTDAAVGDGTEVLKSEVFTTPAAGT